MAVAAEKRRPSLGTFRPRPDRIDFSHESSQTFSYPTLDEPRRRRIRVKNPLCTLSREGLSANDAGDPW
jgi:hypothetical protein